MIHTHKSCFLGLEIDLEPFFMNSEGILLLKEVSIHLIYILL